MKETGLEKKKMNSSLWLITSAYKTITCLCANKKIGTMRGPAPVAQACNPSYSGVMAQSQPQANSSCDPISKIPITEAV
jgi:hypothetical protein